MQFARILLRLLFPGFVFLHLSISGVALAQQQDHSKIRGELQSMVSSHPYRIGIFRFRPGLFIDTGYDSNVFFQEDNPVGDYYLFATPALSTGVKLGRRAYFRTELDWKFLYYRKFEERRDVFFRIPTIELVTGTDRLLTVFFGGYKNDEAPLDTDFDIPTRQRVVNAGVRLQYELVSRIDLLGGYQVIDSSYSVDPEFEAPAVPPDNRRSEFNGGIRYKLRESFSLDGNFIAGVTEFEDSGSRRDYWRVFGGFTADGRKWSGRVHAGYGYTDSGPQDAFRDYLLDAGLDYRIGRHFSVGGFASRRRQVSAFLDDSFSLTTEGGVRFSFPLHRRFFLDAALSAGMNDYNEQTLQDDTFKRAAGALNFIIYRNFVLRAGGNYSKRDSAIDGFSKERFTYIFGVTYSLSP